MFGGGFLVGLFFFFLVFPLSIGVFQLLGKVSSF